MTDPYYFYFWLDQKKDLRTHVVHGAHEVTPNSNDVVMLYVGDWDTGTDTRQVLAHFYNDICLLLLEDSRSHG